MKTSKKNSSWLIFVMVGLLLSNLALITNTPSYALAGGLFEISALIIIFKRKRK